MKLVKLFLLAFSIWVGAVDEECRQGSDACNDSPWLASVPEICAGDLLKAAQNYDPFLENAQE